MKSNKKIVWLLTLAIFCSVTAMGAGWKAKHVVMIGIDGWAGYSVPKAKNIPVIRNLMKNGSYTLTKRSVLPSASAINWASMFMGAGTEMTGYTKWNSQKPEIPSLALNKHGIFPTIYSIIRDQYPKAVTGLTFDWDGIGYVTDTAAISYVKMIKNSDNAPETAIKPGIQYLKEKKPMFMTIYIGGLDETGHAEGWGSDAYYAMLERVDACIGKVIQAVKDAGIYNETIIILSADHGGINKGHGGMTLEELQTPFIVCGKNVKGNYQLKQPMMQFDTAATIAYMFGLKRPSCWIGRPMTEMFK